MPDYLCFYDNDERTVSDLPEDDAMMNEKKRVESLLNN